MLSNLELKTLIIEVNKTGKQSIIYSNMISSLKKIYPNNFIIGTNLFSSFMKIKNLRVKYFLFLLKNIFLISSKIIINTKQIFDCKTDYYLTLRNSIVDQIERETGTLSTKINSNKFIKKNILNFLKKSFKLQVFLQIIESTVQNKRIEAIFIDQLDGYPYSAVTALSIKNNIYIGTFESNKRKIILRKGFLNDCTPLKEDMKEIKIINNNSINEKLEIYKKSYIAHEDKICSPTKKYRAKSEDIRFYKNYFNNKKKNAVVLLHVFTDQARVRLQGTWYESYLDWFLETIQFCKLNKNINWFFKAHPYEFNYPLRKSFTKLIENTIKDNNFTYINSKKNLLHGELAQFASVVVTCTGTCKLEYPSLFNIPVISCIGNYLLYDPLSYPHTAKSQSEYKNLILNAHNLKLSLKDIEGYKAGLYVLKNNLEKTIKSDIKLRRLNDMRGNAVYRNF